MRSTANILPLFLGLGLFLWPADGADIPAPSPSVFYQSLWGGADRPFSFKYGGGASTTFLRQCACTEETIPGSGGHLHRFTFRDPKTHLRVDAEVRTFADFDAVEWVLNFANDGPFDTPILEDIQALRWSMPTPGTGPTTVHYLRGSDAMANDFAAEESILPPVQECHIGSLGGRSSAGNMPFFDVQHGDLGVIGAVGWTGNWAGNFVRAQGGQRLDIAAGMQKTHLLLHPGEAIRTPRVLLLDAPGDMAVAHNRWRQLLLAHHSPKDAQGQVLQGPACLATWGNDLIDAKMKEVRRLREKRVPFDVYWIDAGWYGHEDYHAGSTVFNTPWTKNRGNWWPNQECYPEGFKPLGTLLKEDGMGFLLWIEAEEADPDTTLRKEHPEWFFPAGPGRAALLNLGDPGARQGITDLVSTIVDQAGLTWYRQDFNTSPEKTWEKADAPDRVGMTEIRYIEGLYAFWDELRARHPGLQIDNCASGGRRLDLEAIRRSFALWRTDLSCFTANGTPIAAQTQALAPWIPLSAGCCEGNTTYAMRSAYGPGMVVDTGMNIISEKDPDWLRQAVTEFHEARPFFYGDFYPLLSQSVSPDFWTAFQFHRPDRKAGVAMYFRHEKSPFASMPAALHALDAEAEYEVEVRAELGKTPVRKMSGRALGELSISIPTPAGSTLLFYRQILRN